MAGATRLGERAASSAAVAGKPVTSSAARAFLRNNGLSLVITVLFVVLMTGQVFAGFYDYNHEQLEHGEPSITLGRYLTTGHFIEATAENWESEFLQMAAYVLLTVSLFQKGSSESKAIGKVAAVDRDPRLAASRADAPWPVRRGGWVLKLYENSLSVAFILLFVASFVLHAVGGASAYRGEQVEHGASAPSVIEYLGTSRFWFESLQNWQSEFLSLAAMVVLSIYLRQRGSPESKPVDAPHSHTGSE